MPGVVQSCLVWPGDCLLPPQHPSNMVLGPGRPAELLLASKTRGFLASEKKSATALAGRTGSQRQLSLLG